MTDEGGKFRESPLPKVTPESPLLVWLVPSFHVKQLYWREVSKSVLQAGFYFFFLITTWLLYLFVGKVVECGPAFSTKTQVLNLSYMNMF